VPNDADQPLAPPTWRRIFARKPAGPRLAAFACSARVWAKLWGIANTAFPPFRGRFHASAPQEAASDPLEQKQPLLREHLTRRLITGRGLDSGSVTEGDGAIRSRGRELVSVV
jgi:hypothetical protein